MMSDSLVDIIKGLMWKVRTSDLSVQSLQKLSVKRTASLNKALKELKHHQGLVKKYHQTYTRTTSSRCGTAPCSRAKLRKYSDTSSVGYKTNELPEESPEVQEEFEKEGPPCLSQKTARIQVLQVAASPDDHNVVSSSSQEFLSAKVSVCTQTPKKVRHVLLDCKLVTSMHCLRYGSLNIIYITFSIVSSSLSHICSLLVNKCNLTNFLDRKFKLNTLSTRDYHTHVKNEQISKEEQIKEAPDVYRDLKPHAESIRQPQDTDENKSDPYM
ncbi:uncharacterized protein LOC143235737 [Tachypleus tridentatus]|uniref:uncharacterized protein LOC143235737 n=1 Tax=Tachypleus tridentatus TaxID=6853 RepID=UPI003FD61D6C